MFLSFPSTLLNVGNMLIVVFAIDRSLLPNLICGRKNDLLFLTGDLNMLNSRPEFFNKQAEIVVRIFSQF